MIDSTRFEKFLNRVYKECIVNEHSIYEKDVITPNELLTWKDVENVINFNLGFVDIIDNNSNKIDIPALNYFWSSRIIQSKKSIFSLINSGNCFSITQCFYLNENINYLLSLIESKFDVICDAHLYGGLDTSANSFRPHIDIPSNFIIQIDGETHWKIYKNIASDMFPQEQINSMRVSNLELDYEVVLSPGDCIYIPPRRFHEAIPLGKRLSVSIPAASRKYSNALPVDRCLYEFTK